MIEGRGSVGVGMRIYGTERARAWLLRKELWRLRPFQARSLASLGTVTDCPVTWRHKHVIAIYTNYCNTHRWDIDRLEEDEGEHADYSYPHR